MKVMEFDFKKMQFEPRSIWSWGYLEALVFGDHIYFLPSPKDVKDANKLIRKHWREFEDDCMKYNLTPRDFEFGVVYCPMMNPLDKITSDVRRSHLSDEWYWDDYYLSD